MTKVYGISAYESNSMKSSNPNSGVYEAETSRTIDNNGGNPACNQGGMAIVMDAYQHHGYRENDTCGTLTAGQNQTIRGDTPIVIEGNGSRESHKGDGFKESETMYMLNTVEQHAVFDARGNGDGKTVNTITGDHENRITDYSAVAVNNLVVRRLTPMECERLQGFPDGWTDIGDYIDTKGKVRHTSDGARYKALGNSIALPPWRYVLSRLNEYCSDDKTMASLFDGIGGFPLIWEELNGKGSCVWASEIEEFPIAVTKKHFGE